MPHQRVHTQHQPDFKAWSVLQSLFSFPLSLSFSAALSEAHFSLIQKHTNTNAHRLKLRTYVTYLYLRRSLPHRLPWRLHRHRCSRLHLPHPPGNSAGNVRPWAGSGGSGCNWRPRPHLRTAPRTRSLARNGAGPPRKLEPRSAPPYGATDLLKMANTVKITTPGPHL